MGRGASWDSFGGGREDSSESCGGGGGGGGIRDFVLGFTAGFLGRP